MRSFLVLLGLVGLVLGIYPDDHFDYVTALKSDADYDKVVEEAVSGDHTLFAPSWNEIVKQFANNDDVKFADSVLSGGGPRGSGSPGKGGWPTIRYYNKETGPAGADYEQKTKMAMCSELGPEGGSYLQDYIESAGKTSLCSLDPPYKGCSEKEIKFIGKMATATPDVWAKQLARLSGMKQKKMKADLMAWINARIAILNKLSAASAKEEL